MIETINNFKSIIENIKNDIKGTDSKKQQIINILIKNEISMI